MNGISLFVAIITMIFFSGCSLFGPREEVTEQPKKAVFKSADTPTDDPEMATPIPERVPGETKPKPH